MNGSLRINLAEAGASVADFGTLVPIAAALVLVNGIDPVAALSLAGALFIVSGLFYRVPVPVQPIKAAAAIAIATRASPGVISGAGLLIGGILVLLAVARAAPLLVRIFPKPVIRGNQLGVGILLIVAAASLVRRAPGPDAAPLVAAGALLVLLALTSRLRVPTALALVAGGVAWTLAHGGIPPLRPHPALPSVHVPTWAQLWASLTLLVIPQIPLTLGNAVVGASDLEREYFGERAARVTPSALCLTSGLANVAAGVLGGMPMCHGSSGTTAYYRLGARTGGVNLVAGATLLALGLAYGRTALTLLALIPAPVLGALLAYTGLHHAFLVRDLRGWPLAIALAMGAVGGPTRNLTYAMAVGLPAALLLARRRGGPGAPGRSRRLYSP